MKVLRILKVLNSRLLTSKYISTPIHRVFQFEKWEMWPNYMELYTRIKGYKSKVVYHKKLFLQSGVGFLILCILDFAQRHLVDFWKKRPANFNFIWLEWNSYNSSIQFHIVWSHFSFFKLKYSVDGGWYVFGGKKPRI